MEKREEEGALIAVTTHFFGANKRRGLDYKSLRGKAVAILPDNDDAGRQHALRVAKALHGIAASVCLVELPGLPEKGDIVDWLDAGHDIGELMEPVKEVPELTEDDLAGEGAESQGPAPRQRQPLIIDWGTS